MGRKAKLTDFEWEKIGQRYYAGESARNIADADGRITEAAIRKRFGALRTKVKEVANQIVETERELKALPISSQIAAIDLAAKLRSVSEHLSSAANYGAMTAHRLSGIAHQQVSKIDDADPMATKDTLGAIAALSKVANESAQIGINLLKANKEGMPQDPPDRDTVVTIRRLTA